MFRDTFDQLYDGARTQRYRWDQLYKTEKTHFGTLLEINLQRTFRYADGARLDYAFSGYEVDAKFSQRMGGWMLPPEAVGELCMVMTADDARGTFSMGVVRADPDLLNHSENRDAKKTLSSQGRSDIVWLQKDAALPPNVLLQMAPEDIAAVFKPTGGTERIKELFRRSIGMVVGRAAVGTVAAQLDITRRVRGGQSGARDPLAAEGIVVLGGAYDWQRQAASQLGLPVPRRTEYVAGYVAPSTAPAGQPGVAEGPSGSTLMRTDVASRAPFPVDWYGKR